MDRVQPLHWQLKCSAFFMEAAMICPRCTSENEIAYSVISNGLICLECGFELEMDAAAAHEILEMQEELVCC